MGGIVLLAKSDKPQNLQFSSGTPLKQDNENIVNLRWCDFMPPEAHFSQFFSLGHTLQNEVIKSYYLGLTMFSLSCFKVFKVLL